MIFLLFLPVICFLMSFFVNASLFRPEQKTNADIDGRRVFFSSGRNRLTGYFWNETGTQGLLVFAHGMGTDIAYYLPEIHHFAAQGYKIFAFEYSGYKGSSGKFFGFPQTVIDLKNALDFADDGSQPVLLLGHSMGAYAVCAVQQYRQQPVQAIVAYAPFVSPKAAMAEVTGRMGKYGKLFYGMVTLVQYILFGSACNLNAADGLVGTPALILQGNADQEVTPDGCSLYAHRNELPGVPAMFRLIEDAQSNGHMTVIRKTGSHSVNTDTIQLVDAFLRKTLHEKTQKTNTAFPSGKMP